MTVRSTPLPELLEFVVDNRGRTAPTVEFGIPLIATNCIKDDQLYPAFENVRYVDHDTYDHWFRAHPEPGDILFVLKGSPGRVALVPDPVSFCIAQDMVALRANRLLIDSRYLFYVLRSPSTRQLILNLHVGTMIPHFKKGDFNKLRLNVETDLAIQRAIAEVLGALDDKIAANTKLVQTADELTGSLTRHLLDFENLVPLSSVADVTMGSSPLGTTLNEEQQGDVFYQGVRDFGVRYPTNRVWTTGPVRFAEPFNTLLSVRAPVGQVNLARERTCIGRGIASIRSRVGCPYSIFHILRNDLETWAPYEAEGTIFGSINKSQLESLAVPSIPSEKAGELEQKLGSLELRIASALDENMTLAATRDALLPQLMSGKLRVRDAEKTVEAVV